MQYVQISSIMLPFNIQFQPINSYSEILYMGMFDMVDAVFRYWSKITDRLLISSQVLKGKKESNLHVVWNAHTALSGAYI